MRHFLSLKDFSKEETLVLIDRVKTLKQRPEKLLTDKTLAMIFEKNSTRIRMASELATTELGGKVLFLNANGLQLGREEPFKDTTRVIGSMVGFIMLRVNRHASPEEFAKYSKAPVINALSDLYHPTQILGDLLTVQEYQKEGQITFVGDNNNTCDSWLIATSILGYESGTTLPKNYHTRPEILEFAKEKAKKSGVKITLTNDKLETIKEKEVVITDTWISMGEEEQKEQRIKDSEGFIVDKEAMSVVKKDAILLHCLPVYRGYEVGEEFLEAYSEVIFEEAKNRLFVVKALLCFLEREK